MLLRHCTIEVSGAPSLSALCHCTNCQKRTGSPFGWSTYFNDDKIGTRQGDFGVYALSETNPQQRWFCRKCGTTLFWKAAAMAGHTGIAGGCFADDPLDVPAL